MLSFLLPSSSCYYNTLIFGLCIYYYAAFFLSFHFLLRFIYCKRTRGLKHLFVGYFIYVCVCVFGWSAVCFFSLFHFILFNALDSDMYVQIFVWSKHWTGREGEREGLGLMARWQTLTHTHTYSSYTIHMEMWTETMAVKRFNEQIKMIFVFFCAHSEVN